MNDATHITTSVMRRIDMKRTLTILAVTAMLAGLLATNAFARGPGYGGCPGFGGGPVVMTPEQQQAFETIMDEHQKKMFELRQEMWAKQTELDALQGNDPKRIQTLVAEMKDLRAKAFAEREVLTKKLEDAGIDAPAFGGRGGKRGYRSGGCDCDGPTFGKRGGPGGPGGRG